MPRTSTLTALSLVGAFLLFTASPAAAAPAYPDADGRCVDETGVLGPRLCDRITKTLLRDEARTSDEIAVAVVATTGDTGIDTWSTGLFNAWAVGKKDKNNGVLLVVALDDRRLRLETGRGMGKRLTDRDAAEIIKTVITPEFAKGAYAAGILAGLDAVRRRIGHRVTGDARLATLAGLAPAAAATTGAARPPIRQHDTEDDTIIGGPDYPAPDDLLGGGWPGTGSGFGDVGAGFPSWMCLPFALVAIVVLINVMRGRSGGESSHGSSVSGTRWTRHATWSGASSASTWSGGESDSSSGSSSDFGGGSSDGGGSSGSW